MRIECKMLKQPMRKKQNGSNEAIDEPQERCAPIGSKPEFIIQYC